MQVLYGALVSTAALADVSGETWDVSYAIGQILPKLIEKSEEPGKDFGERVRQRRRELGLALLPQHAVLPESSSAYAGGTQPENLDAMPEDPISLQWWRAEQAERRMQEAFVALAQARVRRASAQEIERLQDVHQHEVQVITVALQEMQTPGTQDL